MRGEPYPNIDVEREDIATRLPQADPGIVPESTVSRQPAIPEPASLPVQRPRPAVATPPPTIDQQIRSETRSVIMGVAGARFLARQVLAGTATTEVHQAAQALSRGEPAGPTSHVININFRPRQPDPAGNMNTFNGLCDVVDFDPFGKDGVLEKLPPVHADHVLAHSLAGGDDSKRVAYEYLIREARRDSTVPHEDLPGLEQIKDVIGVYGGARINIPGSTDYPDDPSSLSDAQLAKIETNTNTKRLGVPHMQGHVADLHMRLTSDVVPPLPSQVEATPGRALLPITGSGYADVAPVQVTRMSVSREATLGRLDAEVRALGTTALIVVTQPWANGNTIPRLQLEGADVLAATDPETMRRIVSACDEAQPPIPLTLTVGAVTDQVLPFLAGGKTVCGDFAQMSPETVSRALPFEEVWEESGVNDSVGANDGVNTGQTTNKGYTPEDTKVNSGTSATAGMSAGLQWNRGTNYTKAVRPARPDELAKNIGEWQAAHWSADGASTGVYDLQSPVVDGVRLRGGRQIRPQLRINEIRPDAMTPAKIREIEVRMKALRAAQEEYGTGHNLEGLPGLPSQPKPPVASRQRAKVPELSLGQQLRELAMQVSGGQSARVTLGLLANEGINLYLSQTDPEVIASDHAEARWVEFAQARHVGPRDAHRAWRQRWGN